MGPINGEVNLNKGTGYDRLSDLVDYQESFLTIFNAILYEKNLDPQLKYETILVNKNHKYHYWRKKHSVNEEI